MAREPQIPQISEAIIKAALVACDGDTRSAIAVTGGAFLSLMEMSLSYSEMDQLLAGAAAEVRRRMENHARIVN